MTITKYIRKQLHEDKIAEQLSLKEYIDPFMTGYKTDGSHVVHTFFEKITSDQIGPK